MNSAATGMVHHERIPSSVASEEIHTVEYLVEDPKAVVIFSHGFFVPGFESNRMFVSAARAFQAAGIRSVLFDYRGSGYSDGEFINVRLESLRSDLETVIAKFKDESVPSYVLGQSLGSGVAALTATNLSSLSGLVLWGFSAHNYERYTEQYLPDGAGEVRYQGNGFPVTRAFVEDFKDHDPMDAIVSLDLPVLFVHGDADDKASIDLPREAVIRRSGLSELIEIPGGNHGFKAQPGELAAAIDISIQWIFVQA